MQLENIDLSTWISLGSVLVAVIGFLWRTARLSGQMEEKFRVQGERLGKVEQSCSAHEQGIEELRRIDQRHEFKMLQLTEAQGQIQGRLEQLISVIERQNESKNRQEVEIAERLARIEERLDLIVKLNSPQLGGNNR